MAKNTGMDYRRGAVSGRSQSLNPKTGFYTKRDDTSGQYVGVKVTGGPFKGVAKESDGRKGGGDRAEVLGRSAATGRVVWKPATRTGAISIEAATRAALSAIRSREP